MGTHRCDKLRALRWEMVLASRGVPNGIMRVPSGKEGGKRARTRFEHAPLRALKVEDGAVNGGM